MIWVQNLYEKIKNLKTKKSDLSRFLGFLKPKKPLKTIFSTPVYTLGAIQ